jgi:hypothetical protein
MVNVQQLFERLYPPAPAHKRSNNALPSSPAVTQPSQRPAAIPEPQPLPAGFLHTPPLSEWLESWKRGPQMVLPPRPCSCRGHLFWTPCPVGGPYICVQCHAPPFPDCAARYIELVFLNGLPRIKVLARQTSTTLK